MAGELTTIHGGDVCVCLSSHFRHRRLMFAALNMVAHNAAMAVRNDETVVIGTEIGTYHPGNPIKFATSTSISCRQANAQGNWAICGDSRWKWCGMNKQNIRPTYSRLFWHQTKQQYSI
jgi:hypothetical protein